MAATSPCPESSSTSPLQRRVLRTLSYETDPSIIGIAQYSHETYTVCYRDGTATADYTQTDIETILEQLQLDTIGTPAIEELHDSTLRAFVRLYEDINTIVVPTDTTSGVVIAHQPDRDRSVAELVDRIETIVR